MVFEKVLKSTWLYFEGHPQRCQDTYCTTSGQMSSLRTLNFDIDHYTNRFIPPNRFDVLPSTIARFLGHRRQDKEKPVGNVLVWLWACLGAFCGILVVEAAYSAPLLRGNGSPIIIGSLVCNSSTKHPEYGADSPQRVHPPS